MRPPPWSGIPNAVEGSDDSDNDGLRDFEDPDSDNDGEAFPGPCNLCGVECWYVTVTKRVRNTLSCPPGILDLFECAQSVDSSFEGCLDSDNDARPDYVDTDSDGW